MQQLYDHWGINKGKHIVGYCGFVGLIIIIIIITSVCLTCAIIAKVTTLGHTFVITSILLLRENTTHEPIYGTTINNNRAENTNQNNTMRSPNTQHQRRQRTQQQQQQRFSSVEEFQPYRDDPVCC
jgi:flagellar basal body-associated protein FliL